MHSPSPPSPSGRTTTKTSKSQSVRSLVYLFDRPILPFYNKVTKLSLVIIVLPILFNVYATASHSFCKLRVLFVFKKKSRVKNP